MLSFVYLHSYILLQDAEYKLNYRISSNKFQDSNKCGPLISAAVLGIIKINKLRLLISASPLVNATPLHVALIKKFHILSLLKPKAYGRGIQVKQAKEQWKYSTHLNIFIHIFWFIESKVLFLFFLFFEKTMSKFPNLRQLISFFIY